MAVTLGWLGVIHGDLVLFVCEWCKLGTSLASYLDRLILAMESVN